jgi:TrmH family RNA methyltransferase
MPILSRNRVAVVFGSEVNGLENKDLALCHEIVAIPSSDAFPSLNLSHAVMVVAYELFMAAQQDVALSPRELAPAEQVEGFYRQLQETLQDLDFLEREHPERIMFSLRQLFGRARLDARDVSILRGILSAVDRKCGT